MKRYFVKFKCGVNCIVYADTFNQRDSVCGYPYKYLAFKIEDRIVADFRTGDLECVEESRLFSGPVKVWG